MLFVKPGAPVSAPSTPSFVHLPPEPARFFRPGERVRVQIGRGLRAGVVLEDAPSRRPLVEVDGIRGALRMRRWKLRSA